MAKKPEIKETSKRDALIALLKARMPACFEREAVPAFAEGNLNKLADEILSL